ncbi:MAG: sigma-70 family RNA polymerase sigma factor [Paludibacteraceae bacterium]|nr:sigma-70 family RNA polymerase sigma factor [Paludibacteraceae bacterium]
MTYYNRDEIARIVSGCQSGNRVDQERLYEVFSAPMMALIRRLVPDRDAASDLLHDGFVIIYTHIGELHDAAKTEPWIRRIMTNLSLRYLEQQARLVSMEQLTSEAILDENVSGQPVPPLDELLRMIERLPNGYREVFKLNVLDGLTHQEIGQMLGIHPKSSSSQLFRARRLLQQMVSDWRRTSALFLLILLTSIGFYLIRQQTSETSSLLPCQEHPRMAHTTPDDIRSTGLQEAEPYPVVKSDGDTKGNRVRTAQAKCDNPPETVPLHAADSSSTMKGMVKTDALVTNDTEATGSPEPTGQTDHADMTGLTADGVAVRDSSCAHDAQPGTLLQAVMPTKTDSDRGKKAVQHHIGLLAVATNSASAAIPTSIGLAKRPLDGENGIEDYVSCGTWEEMRSRLTTGFEPDDADVDYELRQALMQIAQHNNGSINTNYHHQLPLIIECRYSLSVNPHVRLETGLRYTRMTSATTIGNTDYGTHTRHTYRYIGIPLGVHTDLWQRGRWSVYLSGEIGVDIPFASKTYTDYVVGGQTVLRRPADRTTDRLRLSCTLGAGVGWQVGRHVQLYAQPEACWHLPVSRAAENLWTAHPVMPQLPVGLRITY